MKHFLDVTVGDPAAQHQRRRGSFDNYDRMVAAPAPVGLGETEADFLSRRDSFYVASVTDDGWPYVQHRGGPAGFIRVLDRTHLAWADRTGNRQYITAGNLDRDDRVAIIAVDYPNRAPAEAAGSRPLRPRAGPGDARAARHRRTARRASSPSRSWRSTGTARSSSRPGTPLDEVRAATEPLQQRIQQLEAAAAGGGGDR